ncbi:gamma-glutamylcyclotransferase, partial [bacterium]|nr:gamma-glutamylcyclotransferase [bacterium]
MSEKIFYFAYGSNVSEIRMKKRLSRDGEGFYKRVAGTLKGKELVFNKISRKNRAQGYPNLVDNENSYVEGVLYEITIEGLFSLDGFEMYPHYYRRELVEVESEKLGKIEAWVYIANPAKTADGLKPAKDYIEFMLQGDDLLSKEYIEKIRKFETYN